MKNKKRIVMGIFKKLRKKRLQRNLENLQSDMEDLNNQLVDKDESDTARYLVSHPIGNICDLLDCGHKSEILLHFQKLGFLSTTSDLKNNDKNGTYRVTHFGEKQLKLIGSMKVMETCMDNIIKIMDGGD